MRASYNCLWLCLGVALALTPAANGQSPAQKTDDARPTEAATTVDKQSAGPANADVQARPGGTPATMETPSKHANRPPVRSPRSGGFEPDPNAKYVCENPLAVHAPAWRGSQTLTFPFKIHNPGTANLRIRAKGG